MKPEKEINRIFEILSADNPEPKTELEFTNIYTLAVAVILSAQATDIGVNKATKLLFKKIHTPEQMVELGEERLKKYIKSIGLFNSKAKNIFLMSKALIENHSSEIPNDFDKLIRLPGIGRKTANVIMNCAFGEETIAVDTHVFRVSKRVGLASGATPDKVEKELSNIVPKKWKQHAHHWLILHGRYICKARRPECRECKISEFCDYYKEII
ncbi:MAG: endonuclease III [Rickettsiales bacterium]